ncbi:MAG: sigma-54-dependent Fis family transcriptional regulator [Candidatus Glassbacteria bacterium]|nr:sigma-54-dependent Fis family transcriptional regulator [Candidatus Glassbacteria bacterium]
MKILVVEDEESKRLTLLEDLIQNGHAVQAVPDASRALDVLEREGIDVVITDLKLPGTDGLELMRAIKEEIAPSTEVIIMTAFGTIPLAVEAIKNGALDFVTKPFDNHQLLPLLERIENKMARKDPSRESLPVKEYLEIEKSVTGNSPSLRHLKHLVRICSESDANVLLCGETGTGKDLVASVIHKQSRRHSHPFVKVNCAVFPEALIENELFGHERGAFTGADQRRRGRIELASHGTLYLDDVDDIPVKEQVKLLRVIEEKVCEPVGSTTPIHCDVRIIASTKVDLTQKIADCSFREDLFYRLKVLEIHLPPLREHLEDIPLLADHLLSRITEDSQVALTDEIISRLKSYQWPGNVRELSHKLEQAYITGRGELSPASFDFSASALEPFNGSPGSFKSTMDRTERELLRRALEETKGNKTVAANKLGMKPSTFRDKLRKHGLD